MIHSIMKLLIVVLLVGASVFLSFKGEYSESLNGLVGGVALIQAFIILEYEYQLYMKG